MPACKIPVVRNWRWRTKSSCLLHHHSWGANADWGINGYVKLGRTASQAVGTCGLYRGVLTLPACVKDAYHKHLGILTLATLPVSCTEPVRPTSPLRQTATIRKTGSMQKHHSQRLRHFSEPHVLQNNVLTLLCRFMQLSIRRHCAL